LCCACNKPRLDAPQTASYSDETANALGHARELAKRQDFQSAAVAYQGVLLGCAKNEGRKTAAYAVVLDELGYVYISEGQLLKAQALLNQSVDLFAEVAPNDRLEFGDALNDLGRTYYDEAAYAKAEELFGRALSMWEAAGASGRSRVLYGLNNTAVLYSAEGQIAQAEQLLRTAAKEARTQGPENEQILSLTLTNLGLLLCNEKQDYAEADPLLSEALQIREKKFGPNDPSVADTLANLGLLYDDTHKADLSESVLRRAFAIDQSALGGQHPSTVQIEYLLGRQQLHAGRCADAASWLRKSESVRETAVGSNQRELGLTLCRLGESLACAPGDHLSEARSDFERARKILLKVQRDNGQLSESALAGMGEHPGKLLEKYVGLLSKISIERPNERDDAASSAFTVADQLRSGSADTALASAGIRKLSESKMPSSFAHVQDLRIQVEQARKRLMSQYMEKGSGADLTSAIGGESERLQKLESELDLETTELFKAFPDYGELLAPTPITPSEMRPLLKSNETVVAYFALDDDLEIWVMSAREPLRWFEVAIKKAELVDTAARLRASLRVDSPYDVEDAFSLYEYVLKPIRPYLKSPRLLIVTDQTTLQVPFAALVTDGNGKAYSILRERYADHMKPSTEELSVLYPRVHWFFNQGFEMSFLPSATSLRTLRAAKGRQEIPPLVGEPFIGIGDPKLSGVGDDRGGAMLELTGPGVAARVRALPALPATRNELEAEARALGADFQRSVYIQDRATKSNLMMLNNDRLDRTRLVSFATHALVGGEINGLREPALVLTPPEHPTDQDVGLLTLDDILGLRLHQSEWIILSACNTAGINVSESGFSGLVRAFFYAGGHSLLVSQWNVSDLATLELMTSVMNAYVANGRSSRAKALREGMGTLLNSHSTGKPSYLTHPAAWASFFIVGES
jgi:CHAT domain-containing protein/Tfp pilus assembly protein PilF